MQLRKQRGTGAELAGVAGGMTEKRHGDDSPFEEPWPSTDLKKLVASGVVSEETITRAAGRVAADGEVWLS